MLVDVLKQCYWRLFPERDATLLFLLLLLVVFLFATVGQIIAPIIASIVIAYLLESLVSMLKQWHMPHRAAVIIAFLLFMGIGLFSIIAILPLFWQQTAKLVAEIPHLVSQGQKILVQLPQQYPDYISLSQIQHYMNLLKQGLVNLGQLALSLSVSTIPNLVVIIVYAVTVPLLVFFFLNDKTLILNWFANRLPQNSALLRQVWDKSNIQIGRYVRGKVYEAIIVAVICFITFSFLGLPYSVLLASLVGLSVIIPYIGAVVVTIPIVVLALMQWGLSAHFIYLMVAYTIIIIVDANILVPLLFAEAVNLHPSVIILAVIVFGGLWGFWGVFFAIPLAGFIRTLMDVWPEPRTQSV